MTRQELEARVAELEAQLATKTKPSKSREQAEKAVELLKAGPVTTEQLAAINPKYPSDPIYYARTLLKQAIKTNRKRGQATTYQLA